MPSGSALVQTGHAVEQLGLCLRVQRPDDVRRRQASGAQRRALLQLQTAQQILVLLHRGQIAQAAIVDRFRAQTGTRVAAAAAARMDCARRSRRLRKGCNRKATKPTIPGAMIS